MATIIVLDSGPLGLASAPPALPNTNACREWLWRLRSPTTLIVVPEIVDFEVRRELLRTGRTSAIERLDELVDSLLFAPIKRETMLLAAKLWADVRQRGVPTAGPQSLDADCIIAARALLVSGRRDDLTIATSNPDHLTRFGVHALPWEQIDR